MKLISIFCILFFFGNSIGISGEIVKWRCDYNYDYQVKKWFKFHDIPMTWFEARLACHFEGAQLASPTPDVIEIMQSIIDEGNIPSEKAFTGIHATFSSKIFSSLEGLQLSMIPHKWAAGEPSNGVLKTCISINKNGTLATEKCSERYPFICYKDNKDIQINNCGTFDNEYFQDNRTGSCYKFHRDPQTWDNAYWVCEAEGGHLAIINSDVEAVVIQDLFEKYPRRSLPRIEDTNSALIGFFDVFESVQWITIHGKTLKEAGYDKFAEGYPKINKFLHSGCIFRNGLLAVTSSDRPGLYICEKELSTIDCY